MFIVPGTFVSPKKLQFVGPYVLIYLLVEFPCPFFWETPQFGLALTLGIAGGITPTHGSFTQLKFWLTRFHQSLRFFASNLEACEGSSEFSPAAPHELTKSMGLVVINWGVFLL